MQREPGQLEISSDSIQDEILDKGQEDKLNQANKSNEEECGNAFLLLAQYTNLNNLLTNKELYKEHLLSFIRKSHKYTFERKMFSLKNPTKKSFNIKGLFTPRYRIKKARKQLKKQLENEWKNKITDQLLFSNIIEKSTAALDISSAVINWLKSQFDRNCRANKGSENRKFSHPLKFNY